jgi:hypothetical protein
MSSATSDWSCHSPSFLLGWGLPIAGMSISGAMKPEWMFLIWPIALLWISVACLVNASRCGRVHCYFTGTFFFILAVLSGLHGFNIVDLGASAWTWIGITAIAGGIALTILPEMIWGRYRGPGSTQPPMN